MKDEWYSKKKDFDADVQSKRNKLQAQEKALEVREENIDRKVELLGKKEREQVGLKRNLEEQSRALDARQDGAGTPGRRRRTIGWNGPPGSRATKPSAS